MSDFTKVAENLRERGYSVSVFDSGREAALYLDSAIDARTVGIGGSATVRDTGVYELLQTHNTVYWHWVQEAGPARLSAMNADIYISSVNALAATGEMVSIDGIGNRLSSMLFGHKKIYYLIGRNKLAADLDAAILRARNVASPQRAQQLGAQTPCAVKADRCYDCKSPGRICRALVTLWGPLMGTEAEVILIDGDYGL